MHDIRWIRDNPERSTRRSTAGRPRRAIAGRSSPRTSLLALDEAASQAIQQFEQAQARRNAASKEIGKAKAKKDEATARR